MVYICEIKHIYMHSVSFKNISVLSKTGYAQPSKRFSSQVSQYRNCATGWMTGKSVFDLEGR
jgi:hypothetical protein